MATPNATEQDGVAGLVELTKRATIEIPDEEVLVEEFAVIMGGFAYLFKTHEEAVEASKQARSWLLRCPSTSVTCRASSDLLAHLDKHSGATIGNLVRAQMEQLHDLNERVKKMEEVVKSLGTITAPMNTNNPPPFGMPCVYWPQPPHGVSTYLPPYSPYPPMPARPLPSFGYPSLPPPPLPAQFQPVGPVTAASPQSPQEQLLNAGKAQPKPNPVKGHVKKGFF